jgi:tetratricopeptide (TPR) repeat protein
MSSMRYNVESADITKKELIPQYAERIMASADPNPVSKNIIDDTPLKKNNSPAPPKGDIADAPPPPTPDQVDMEQYHALLEKVKGNASNSRQIALLRDAIVLNPDGDEALARLSILLMDSPKTRQEALSLAERAAAANEENAMAWLVIGYIAQMNGKSGEARAAYQRCAAAPGPMRCVRDCRSLM